MSAGEVRQAFGKPVATAGRACTWTLPAEPGCWDTDAHKLLPSENSPSEGRQALSEGRTEAEGGRHACCLGAGQSG